MKIYVLQVSSYDYQPVCGVFSTLDEAQRAIPELVWEKYEKADYWHASYTVLSGFAGYKIESFTLNELARND